MDDPLATEQVNVGRKMRTTTGLPTSNAAAGLCRRQSRGLQGPVIHTSASEFDLALSASTGTYPTVKTRAVIRRRDRENFDYVDIGNTRLMRANGRMNRQRTYRLPTTFRGVCCSALDDRRVAASRAVPRPKHNALERMRSA